MKVVSIRLSEAAAARYQALADQTWPSPIALSTYLKRRLEEGDAIAEHLDSLRLDIRDLAVDVGRGHGLPDGGQVDSVAIETLLLLRNKGVRTLFWVCRVGEPSLPGLTRLQ